MDKVNKVQAYCWFALSSWVIISYLAALIGDTGKVLDSLVVDLIAAVPVATLATPVLAVLVLWARLSRRDANSGRYLALVVMPEAVLLLCPLLGAVLGWPAKVQGQGLFRSDGTDCLPGVAEVLEADVVVESAAVVVLDAGRVPFGVVHAEHRTHHDNFTEAYESYKHTAQYFLHSGWRNHFFGSTPLAKNNNKICMHAAKFISFHSIKFEQ